MSLRFRHGRHGRHGCHGRHGAGVAFAAWVICSAPAFAACHYPQKPDNIPNGSTSTLNDMMVAQKAVRQYSSDIGEFLKCLDAASPKSEDITPKLSDEQRQALVKQIELIAERKAAAVADEQAVIARYNDQVQAFKARQSP